MTRDLFRLSFAKTVLVRFFFTNQGLLLAGAVSFYALMSLVPLVGLLLVLLSTFVDVTELSDVMVAQLDMLVAGGALAIMREVEKFIEHRELAGGIGLVVVTFFGSLAFSTLDKAMAVIFRARRERVRRHIITSLIIPYAYMAALAVGLLLMTGVTVVLGWAGERVVSLGATTIDLGGPIALLIAALRFAVEVILITSIYLVFPGGRVKLKHALMGGTIAAILWEVTRRILVWYYAHLSVVSLVYGSLATTIVALLTMEVGAVIVLFSAQVIAEYELLTEPQSKPRPPQNPDETFSIALSQSDKR